MSPDVPAPESNSREKSESPAGAPRLRSLARAFGPALAMLLAALYSLVVVCRAGGGVPSEGEWRQATERVRSERSPGDLIVFAPEWIDPLGREYLGDMMDLEMMGRMDAARYPRIWELAEEDARAPESRGLSVELEERFGPLRLRRYRQDAVVPRYDFTANWQRAAVSGQMQGRPNLSFEEVGFEPHRCIKVVPRPDQSASLRFEKVPLGSKIVGYVGLADVFTRRDVREPGRLELLVDGVLLASVRAGVDDGWRRFEAETSAGQGEVEFRLTAVGPGARDRRICFAAEARP